MHYVYPEEGTIFWMDNMVIPKHAENKDATYAFINVLMKRENQAVLVEDIAYAVPNLGALEHLPDALRNSEVIFPPTEVKQKGQFLSNIGEAVSIYNQYWLELKK
ncbi:extracellular solute-binding protein [Enterovibrio norvegicus]|uniref:extracellular solute-binding protein n=1 Tax=Enterovibrio norvegicus TaxID=188144 RepID=UPI000C820770|nr:extracellular solute-binding protein [Enterovibrio norvegicus]MCC4797206.1 extracellular solute-binding protein [Enterovibrio norvegicus]TKF08707.1 extracellular solute-binding protein [Enterovibrio norvegicus]TKF35320.1 extracellular solute-binding protein [Enterovibrio norvegicus]